MTRQELTKIQATNQKRVCVYLSIAFAFPMIGIPLQLWLEPRLEHLPPMKRSIVLLATMSGWMLALVVGMVSIRRFQRRGGLLCSKCQKPLIGKAGKVTVATGRCGHCGHEVLRESAEPSAPQAAGATTPSGTLIIAEQPSPLTRDNFVAKRRLVKNRVALVSFLPWVFAGAFFFSMMSYESRGGRLSPSADVILPLSFSAVFLGMLVWAVYTAKRVYRRYGLACPHCSRLFDDSHAGEILLATRRCCHCGSIALTDAAPNGGSMPPAAESQALQEPPSES